VNGSNTGVANEDQHRRIDYQGNVDLSAHFRKKKYSPWKRQTLLGSASSQAKAVINRLIERDYPWILVKRKSTLESQAAGQALALGEFQISGHLLKPES
jgi:hypothetical protein